MLEIYRKPYMYRHTTRNENVRWNCNSVKKKYLFTAEHAAELARKYKCCTVKTVQR